MTVRQVANVVANENNGVTPGTSSPQALQEAKTAQANAVMNADYQYGANRQNVVPTAPATVSTQGAGPPFPLQKTREGAPFLRILCDGRTDAENHLGGPCRN